MIKKNKMIKDLVWEESGGGYGSGNNYDQNYLRELHGGACEYLSIAIPLSFREGPEYDKLPRKVKDIQAFIKSHRGWKVRHYSLEIPSCAREVEDDYFPAYDKWPKKYNKTSQRLIQSYYQRFVDWAQNNKEQFRKIVEEIE